MAILRAKRKELVADNHLHRSLTPGNPNMVRIGCLCSISMSTVQEFDGNVNPRRTYRDLTPEPARAALRVSNQPRLNRRYPILEPDADCLFFCLFFFGWEAGIYSEKPALRGCDARVPGSPLKRSSSKSETKMTNQRKVCT